ncbi:MAG: type II toxin-antitoxin system ParD family antitoxin [Thermodesulfobacteriota bacterium]
MAINQEKKLELLRRDIREGLESGDPTPWNMDEFLQEARRRRVALKREEPEA